MKMGKHYEIVVLFNGYSHRIKDGMMKANCTCTLIKGEKNIIIDTMTAWDGPKLIAALNSHQLQCSDIDYVVCTHGHSDHIGCNYLFDKATHIVGYSISKEDIYYDFDFTQGDYIIDEQVKIIATPGHTMQDVSVLVETNNEVTAITGDLFECEDDLRDDMLWKEAGSDDERLQMINRTKILNMADFIVPGHGKMFRVRLPR